MSRLTNALQMLDILSARSVVSLDELADTLEISTRAVQRLKDDLESVGYHIDTKMGPNGGYTLKYQTQIHPIEFNIEERKILKQALALVMHQNSTQSRDFVRAVSKLSRQLDYPELSMVESFQSVRLNIDPEKYQNFITTLTQAIESCHRVTLEYNKNHRETKTYRFDPYELVLVNKLWYVFGYDEKGRYLSLKINKINDVTILESTFLKDENTSSRQVLSDYGYKIQPVMTELLITDQDYLSEYIWGKNQTITWLDDHRFKLEVEFPNEMSVKNFVMRSARHITIIEPVWLKDWLYQEAQEIIERYKQ